MLYANTINDIWLSLPPEVREWLQRNYQTGIQIFIVLMAAKLFNRYSSRLIQRVFAHAVRSDMYPNKADRTKRLNTLNSMAKATLQFVVWVAAFIIIIGLLGINTGPLFAGAGLLAAGIAFGAQSLIKDLLSGIFIISENQYRVGDYIEVMGVSGTVESIGLRTTVLRDISGSVHHIPNGSIVVTTNQSMGQGRINLDIAVVASTDVALLEHVINHAGERLASNVKLKDDIIETPKFSRITDYTGNAVTVKIQGKTVGGKQLQVKSALLAQLKRDFDENNIKLAIIPVLGAAPKKKLKN